MERQHPVARFVLVLFGGAGSGAVVLALTTPWLPSALGGPASPGRVGLPDLVATGCALALTASWAWLTLGAVLVAVQVLCPRSWAARWRLRWVPRTLRVLVPVLLGTVVAAAPASAGPEADPRHLTGLSLPDRLATSRPAAQRTVLVRPGDSLWRITARLLPDAAPPATLDRGWRRLARANATHVPDPDLILPGTRLRVPPLTTHPREEAP